MLHKDPLKRMSIKKVATQLNIDLSHQPNIQEKMEKRVYKKIVNLGYPEQTVTKILKSKQMSHVSALYKFFEISY